MKLALKEWPAAISALENGKMILLFRKGGIHEQADSFILPSNQSLLFPSFEHQKSSMLKTQTLQREKVTVHQPGDTIAIHSWVEFRDCIEVKTQKSIQDLRAFHIWTDKCLSNKLSWKPNKPLFALLCFTYRFTNPIEIVYQAKYGGCKSWIDLKKDLHLPDSIPVQSEHDFTHTAECIKKALR